MTIYRDDLERVYALIEAPERWCQNTDARDAEGDAVGDTSARAVSWCLLGAFHKIGIPDNWRAHTELLMPDLDIDADLERANRDGTAAGVSYFNDTHTHAEVLALLRQAIERAPVREVQIVKFKCASIEFSPDRKNPTWLVVVRGNNGKEIFTAGYEAKHVAQQAARAMNRAVWLVAK